MARLRMKMRPSQVARISARSNGATQAILVRKLIAAHGGKAALGDGFLPRGDVAIVLRVGVLDAADGGDAHAVEIGAGFGCVALKIAVQRAVLLGDGQFVAGLREVVHADVEIAGLEKFEEPGAENFKFFHAFGKMRSKRTLLLFEPGNVRIAEESDAIRSELKDLVHGMGKAIRRLVGQTVDQVDVNAVKAQFARGEEQVPRHFEWLNAVNGFLNIGMKVLDAHAQTIKAQLVKRFEMLTRGDSRIDFDANFAVGGELEVLPRETEQILDLFRRQVSGCAAAPVELYDRAIFGNAAADAFRFTLEDIKI